MNALLLSAYHAHSHAYWCRQIRDLSPAITWTELSLPPRHFNWRIRGNSLSWGFSAREELNKSYDLLVATSMVDLCSLRGFLPQLAAIPTLLYFHENQFAYPVSEQGRPAVEAQLVPIYSALCADKLAFNSAFNRREFLSGASRLLTAFPDFVPGGIQERLEDSIVLPVPIAEANMGINYATTNTGGSKAEDSQPGNGFSADFAALVAASDHQERAGRTQTAEGKMLLEVVWNHRWEYDKGPALLLEIVDRVVTRELPLRFHIVGQQFRRAPKEFNLIADLLALHAKRLGVEPGAYGYVSGQQDYQRLLGSADVVLSTADHDFQGLALQEGIVRGCTPLAPDRLVYPEYVRSDCLYANAAHLDAAARLREEADSAVAKLEQWCSALSAAQALPKQEIVRYGAEFLGPQYRRVFDELRRYTKPD